MIKISNNSKNKNTDSTIIRPLKDNYSLSSNDTIFIPDLEVEIQIKKFFPLINLKNTYFGFQFIKPKIAKLSIELYSNNSYPQKNLLKGIINEYGLFKQNVDKQIALFYYYKSAFEDKEPLAFYYLYQLNLFDKIREYSFNLNSKIDDKDKEINELNYSESLLNSDFSDIKDTPYSSLIISNISRDEVFKEISKFPLSRNRDLEIFFLICSIVYLPPSFTYISNEGDYKGINPKHTIALHLDLEDKCVEKMSKLISKIWNNWGNNNNSSNNSSSVNNKNNFFINLPFSEQDFFFIKSVFEFTFNKPGSDYYNKVPYIYQDNIINTTNIPYTLKHSESQDTIIKEILSFPDHQKNEIQDHLFYIYYQKLEYLAKVHNHDYSLGHLGFINSSLFLPNINNTDIPLTYFISDKAHPPNNNYKIAIKYFNKLRENSTSNSNINSQKAYKFFLPYEVFLYSNINDTIIVKKLAKENNNNQHPKSNYILFDVIMLEIQKSYVFENIITQAEELTRLLINDIIEGGIYSVFEVINLKYLINKYFKFSLSCSLDVEEELISLLTLKYHGKVNWFLYNPCDDEKAEFNFSLGQALYLKYKKECSDIIKDMNEIEKKERELNDEIERELCLKEAQLSFINSNGWCDGFSNNEYCYRSSRLNKINNTYEIINDINFHERIDIKDRIRSGSADIYKKFISNHQNYNANIHHDDSIFTLNNVSNNKNQLIRANKSNSSNKLNKSISLSIKKNENYENNNAQNNNIIKDLTIINNTNDYFQFNIDNNINNINKLGDQSTNKANQLTPQSNFCDYSFRESNNKDNYKKGQSNKSNFNAKNDINNNSNSNQIAYKENPVISDNMRKSIPNNFVNSKEDEDLDIISIKDNKKNKDHKENNMIKEYINKSDKKESNSRGLFRKFINAQDNDFDLYSVTHNPFNIENLKNNEIKDSCNITKSLDNNDKYDDVYKISSSILDTVNKAKKNNIFSFGQVKAKDYSNNIKNNDDNKIYSTHNNTNLNEFSLSNNHINSYNLFTSSNSNNINNNNSIDSNNNIKEENIPSRTTFNRIFNRQFTNKTDFSIRSHYIKKSEHNNMNMNTNNTANNANTVNFNNDTNINSNNNREQINNLFNFNNNISSISRTINKRSIINSLISSKKSINSHSNTNKSNSNIFFNSNNQINNRSLNIINETDNNLFNFELETNTPYTEKKINHNNNHHEDSDDNRDTLANNNINNINNNLSNIVKADSITSNLCLDNNNESDHELSNNDNTARNRIDSMTDINNLIDIENSDFEETNEENVSSESSRLNDNYSSQGSNSSSNYNIYINNNNNDRDSEIEGVSNKHHINDYKTIIFNEEKDFNIDYKEENSENNENKDNDINISDKITKLAVLVKQVNKYYNSKSSNLKNDKNNKNFIPTIHKNNDSDNINSLLTNTCKFNIKNNSTTSNILNACNTNNISDSNKIANKNSSTLGIKNFLSSKQITTIKSAQMSSMLLNQQNILSSNNNINNNDHKDNDKDNNKYNSSISTSSPYLQNKIAKLNQLSQRKKALFNLKKTITTKLNFCITLFNKANQTTKNNNYRRYVLACILKIYLKIEVLKPKTSGTRKKIATMKREVTSTLKHVFEESVKQTPLKFLSSSFYYQLGKNYLSDNKIETALSYLQLGKLSFNKSLGYGSILSYFRKFKLEKMMSSYEEYLAIKKEVSEIKTNKGIKNCYECSNNIKYVGIQKSVKEEDNINQINDNEHYKAFNNILICKKSINEYFIYHKDFVDYYIRVNSDLFNYNNSGEEKDSCNKENKFMQIILNSPLTLTKQLDKLNTNDNINNMRNSNIEDSSMKTSNLTTTTEICDICFEEPKQTVFYPCKHTVCCLNCTYKIIYNKSCPLCRQGISLFL